MWLLNSSIGRKLIMSISGLFLILFLVFHLCMNIAAVFSGEAYNMVCELLGTNWYALVGTLVLAAGVVIHFVYAIMLTLQNRRARGNDRYALSVRPKGVEWASQNMFVLGLIVILFMILHFSQFWYHMMFAELAGNHAVEVTIARISSENCRDQIAVGGPDKPGRNETRDDAAPSPRGCSKGAKDGEQTEAGARVPARVDSRIAR